MNSVPFTITNVAKPYVFKFDLEKVKADIGDGQYCGHVGVESFQNYAMVMGRQS